MYYFVILQTLKPNSKNWNTKIKNWNTKIGTYSVFQGFIKAKFPNGGSILSSSQFSILPQLAQKMKLASKVVKIDSKIIISLPKIYIPETHCMIDPWAQS
jgi:hypothetical protein